MEINVKTQLTTFSATAHGSLNHWAY